VIGNFVGAVMKYFIDKPEQIKISLTNVCNYRCIMCYNPNLKQKRGYIEDDLLFKVLDECEEEGIHKVSLGSTGEPFLHKSFVKYLKYAKSLGLSTSTTSNCSVLTKELAQSLIGGKLDRFNISIYSSSPEEHKKYTGTDEFYKVCENVRYFLNLWHESKREMEVNMWFLQLPHINNYNAYLKLWGPLAEKVGIALPLKEPVNWGGLSDVPGDSSSLRKVWLEKNSDETNLAWNRTIRCPHIRYYMYVLHDGIVVPCCNIPEIVGCNEVEFGNIYKERIIDIWHSKRYLAFKKDLYSKKVSRYGPCRKCSDIKEISRTKLSFHNLPKRLQSIMYLVKNGS